MAPEPFQGNANRLDVTAALAMETKAPIDVARQSLFAQSFAKTVRYCSRAVTAGQSQAMTDHLPMHGNDQIYPTARWLGGRPQACCRAGSHRSGDPQRSPWLPQELGRQQW